MNHQKFPKNTYRGNPESFPNISTNKSHQNNSKTKRRNVPQSPPFRTSLRRRDGRANARLIPLPTVLHPLCNPSRNHRNSACLSYRLDFPSTTYTRTSLPPRRCWEATDQRGVRQSMPSDVTRGLPRTSRGSINCLGKVERSRDVCFPRAVRLLAARRRDRRRIDAARFAGALLDGAISIGGRRTGITH